MRITTGNDRFKKHVIRGTAHITRAYGVQRCTDAEKFAGSIEPDTLGTRRLFVGIVSHRSFPSSTLLYSL